MEKNFNVLRNLLCQGVSSYIGISAVINADQAAIGALHIIVQVSFGHITVHFQRRSLTHTHIFSAEYYKNSTGKQRSLRDETTLEGPSHTSY